MAFLGKYKKLSPTEQKVRLDLLQYGIAEGGTIPWKEAQRIARESLGESQGQDAPEVDSVLKGLEERHYFKRDEEGEICYLYPFSAYPTDYHVFLEDGSLFGRIKDVMETGANDVYIVQTQEKEVLIPAIKDCILQVDVESNKMVIHLMKGLV